MIRKKNKLGLVLLLSCGLLCLSAAVQAGPLPRVVQPSTSSSASTDSYGNAPVAQAAPQAAVPVVNPPVPVVPGSGTQEYILGIGDKVKLTVYGEADISGEYEVSSTGVLALPLIGDVPAANMTASAFEKQVREKLADGYLNDPRVSAQVTSYRPFFILGEVAKPGSYPYVNGMTVVNAVALAGGYTYRADKGDMTVTRASDPHKEADVEETEVVMPGDIIRVPERFF
ncbi:MAG: polysaccharide export protein [Alphaproteobacteria bacterium]|nr:polysaccharide export protein [Alphaproteobacteria bacterium]